MNRKGRMKERMKDDGGWREMKDKMKDEKIIL
jgi:hypothetical protein